MDTVQSLERGLKIMELLAEEKVMTATQVGARLGLHQSSASRLLNSLVKGGFVRKPDYRSFALDYGALAFAGRAMEGFPAIERAANVCNAIARTHGFSATVAMLRNERLLYLTRSNDDASLVLVSSTDWPLSQSVPGLILAWEKPREQGIDLLSRDGTLCPQEARELYDHIGRRRESSGYLFMENFGNNRFNCGLPFDLESERAALAVFSPTREALPREEMITLLRESIRAILA